MQWAQPFVQYAAPEAWAPVEPLRWVRLIGRPGAWALKRGQTQVGGWWESDRVYWQLDGGATWRQMPLPLDAPPFPAVRVYESISWGL